jgi:uncharacterized protein (TIGR02231 family)
VITLLLSLVGLVADSKVDSVVVYPSQVLVVRTATVSVSGPGELSFPGLPGGLDDNTIRVKASGLRIGEVQVEQGYLAEPTPAVKALKQKVENLEDALKRLNDEADVLKAKEEFLKSVKLGAPELIAKDLQSGRVSADAWRSALSFMGEELGRVMARKVALSREVKSADEALQAAQQEYNAARAAFENRKEVRFDFDADAGVYNVRLSYVVSGANWSPYYELRAKPGEGSVGVTYYAKLVQSTGEDWERVKVVLSTTEPASGQTAPEPYPWYLSLEEEYRRSVSRTMFKVEAAPAPPPPPGGYDGMMGELVDEVEPVETGISLQYVVPGRVSLKSGEPAKKLELHETSLPAEFSYYALPRSSQQAFLRGRMVNSSDFVFLAGSANTYVGEEFTGSTWLATVASQESTEVSFGVDERVKVKRELVKSFKSNGGLFAKTEKQQFVYKTTIENYQPKAIDIEIVEQVPVSQQGEIKVTVTKVEPKFLEEDKDKGTFTWKPKLEAKGKFTIDLEFHVECPAGKRVQGLF